MTSSDTSEILLHEKLQQLAITAEQQPLTVSDGLYHLRAEGSVYGVPLLFLSLVGALPIPTFGLKPIVGVAVLLLGLQLFFWKTSVWLPRKLTDIKLRPSWILRVAHFGERIFPRIEGFAKPRANWMAYKLGFTFLALAVISLSLIFMLSIIPGSKILAGLILFTLSIGLIKNDGLLTLLASIAAFTLLALHAEIVYLLMTFLK